MGFQHECISLQYLCPLLCATAPEIGHSEDNSHDHAQQAPQSLNQDLPKESDWCIHYYLAVHFPWETAKNVENKKLFSVMATKLNILYIKNSKGFAPGKYIWQGNQLIRKE